MFSTTSYKKKKPKGTVEDFHERIEGNKKTGWHHYMFVTVVSLFFGNEHFLRPFSTTVVWRSGSGEFHNSVRERQGERERGTYPRNKVQKWFTQRFSKGKVFLLLFLFKWVLVRWGKKLKKEGCYNRSKVSVKAMVVLFVFSCSTVHHFFCLACAIRIDGDCGASNSEIARKSKQKQKKKKKQ